MLARVLLWGWIGDVHTLLEAIMVWRDLLGRIKERQLIIPEYLD